MNGSTRHRIARLTVIAALGLLGSAPACAPRPSAGSIGHLDDQYGFLKTHFEARLASFPDLEYVRDQKGLACYRRHDDPLEVGKVKVGYIHYCFYGDQLASITVWAAGSDNATQLMHDMRVAYGKGQRLTSKESSKQPIGEMWTGKRVTAVLLFITRQDYPSLDSNEVVLTMSSNRLLRDNDTAKQETSPASPRTP